MGSRSSTQQSLPSWALPAAQKILATGEGLIQPGADNGHGYEQPQAPSDLYQQVAGFDPAQILGMNYLTNQAAGGQADLANAGSSQLQQTLAGMYMNPESNPYLENTYQAAARGLTNEYQMATAPSLLAQAQQYGVAGGSANDMQRQYQQFQLGQSLSDLAANIYGGNYQNERNRQAQAVGQVGAAQGALASPGQTLLGVGTLGQGQTQAELDASTANAALREEYPYKKLSYLANLLGAATTGGGQVTAGTSK